MPRALEALSHILHRLETGELTALEAIDALLSEDCALRQTRRIEIALRTTKIIPIKIIESFDFAFQPSLDRERIAALAQLASSEDAKPSTSSDRQEPENPTSRPRSASPPPSKPEKTSTELTDNLAKAERQGRLAEKIRFLARAALLIVDEIGYLPIMQGGASLFFQIVNASCEKAP